MLHFRLLVALFALFCLSIPAEARWSVAETAHFRIYSEQGEKQLREDAAMLEDFHSLLELVTRRPWPKNARKLDIHIVPGIRELQLVRPELSSNTAGFYAASPDLIAAFSTRGNANFAQEALLHEYAHHFMMQVSQTAMPSWYVEGFAEYLMTAKFRPEAVEWGEVDRGRAFQLVTAGWLPMEKLLGPPEKIDIAAFYAQSWLLTNYMFRVDGMAPKLQAYLRKVSEGGDPVDSFRTEVDPDLVGFQRKLRTYINGRSRTYTRMKREPPEAMQVKISALPESTDGMLLPMISMLLPQKAETDARSLKNIRAQAAKRKGDAWAERTLAIAESIGGEPGTAAQLLDTELAKTPDDTLLLRRRALLYKPFERATSEADLKAARRLLTRAFRADPGDWRTMRDYVQTFSARDHKLPKNELNTLLAAYSMAPQVKSLALMTGDALAHAGRYEEAWIVMSPIIYDPHSSGVPDKVKDYMAALKVGDAAKVEAFLRDGELDFEDDGKEEGATPPVSGGPG